jgi:hypothetical protein
VLLFVCGVLLIILAMHWLLALGMYRHAETRLACLEAAAFSSKMASTDCERCDEALLSPYISA